MYEYKMLRKIFIPKKDEVSKNKLLNLMIYTNHLVLVGWFLIFRYFDVLHSCSCIPITPSIVRIVKSRKLYWAGHVAKLRR